MSSRLLWYIASLTSSIEVKWSLVLRLTFAFLNDDISRHESSRLLIFRFPHVFLEMILSQFELALILYLFRIHLLSVGPLRTGQILALGNAIHGFRL